MAGFNHWGKIAAGLKPACQKAVNNTVDFIEDTAKAGAAVRTGFMQENVYHVHTDGSSTYGSGSIAPPGDSYLLPEVTPDNDMQAIVGAAASHSIYVDMGTRFMPAQPFFTPAAQSGSPFLDSELSHVFPGLTGSIT